MKDHWVMWSMWTENKKAGGELFEVVIYLGSTKIGAMTDMVREISHVETKNETEALLLEEN